MIKKIRKLLSLSRQINFPIWDAPNLISKLSFSQTGEDCIVNFIFKTLKISHPSYIDIGAYHPYSLSNSAKFYVSGSKGINVEPNPDSFNLFQKYRPLDINLNVGIGSKRGTLKYFVMDAAALNTFSEEDATSHVEKWGRKILKTIDIPIVPMNDVIIEHSGGIFPDFLDLDAEGIEMDILRNMDFGRTKPKVICIETLEYSE